jgi:hypothetical protein
MFPIMTPPSPETIAFLQAESNEEGDYQADVQQARDYDSGRQFVALTERLREFLGGDTANDSEDWKRLRLNICHIILSAVVDRLIVSGFDTDEAPQKREETDERGELKISLIKPVAAWAWLIWQRNRMDAKQRRVHEAALRDGEAFVIVDWDNNSKRPRFNAHVRFVDVSGVDTRADVGEGCRAFYRNDDSDQDLLFVTKRWTEVLHTAEGTRNTRQRLTVYLPGEIRKYSGFPGAWRPTQDSDTEPWPIPWLDKKGLPLGIPVAHFISSAGMEAREAWPIQNAINKALVDLMQESDVAAFRIFLAFGWEPVDSDGNPLEIKPGTWLGSSSDKARGEVIPGGDLSQFMNLIESLMLWAAQVTDTPTSRFITTKQVSSEGAQKEQGSSLLTKTRNRQGELGNGWEYAMYMAMRLENTYGKGGLDETAFLQTQWEPLEARDTKAELEQAEIMKGLGMPIPLIGKAINLTQEEIALWEEEAERRAALTPVSLPTAQSIGQPDLEETQEG